MPAITPFGASIHRVSSFQCDASSLYCSVRVSLWSRDKFLVQNAVLEDSEFAALEGKDADEVAPLLSQMVCHCSHTLVPIGQGRTCLASGGRGLTLSQLCWLLVVVVMLLVV